MLLRRLRKREADDSVRDAVGILQRARGGSAGVDAARVVLLRGSEPGRDEIDLAGRLPDTPGAPRVAQPLEMGPALIEAGSRDVEVTQPEVNLADALQRVRLQRAIAPRLPVLEHDRVGVQRARKIALRRERASEPL